LAMGRTRLTAIYGDQFLPVLVPPGTGSKLLCCRGCLIWVFSASRPGVRARIRILFRDWSR
jgi:hypothetical protein